MLRQQLGKELGHAQRGARLETLGRREQGRSPRDVRGHGGEGVPHEVGRYGEDHQISTPKSLAVIGGGEQAIGQSDAREIARVLVRRGYGSGERRVPGPQPHRRAPPSDLEREGGAPAARSHHRHRGGASHHAAEAR
jgi:hypothetical protein